jgi:hypothetical protein
MVTVIFAANAAAVLATLLESETPARWLAISNTFAQGPLTVR